MKGYLKDLGIITVDFTWFDLQTKQLRHFFYLYGMLTKHAYFAFVICFMLLFPQFIAGQDQNRTITEVEQLVEKKAEYHRLTDGEQDGYRIKIHFGVDRDKAKAIRTKFATSFEKYITYEEYQQPNFVVLVGDFKTKLEAYEALKKIQGEFPNSFIVKGRIKVKK